MKSFVQTARMYAVSDIVRGSDIKRSSAVPPAEAECEAAHLAVIRNSPREIPMTRHQCSDEKPLLL